MNENIVRKITVSTSHGPESFLVPVYYNINIGDQIFKEGKMCPVIYISSETFDISALDMDNHVSRVEKIDDPHNTIIRIIHNDNDTVVFFADGTKSVTRFTPSKVSASNNPSEGEVIAILKRYLPHRVFRTIMKSLDRSRGDNRQFYHSDRTK